MSEHSSSTVPRVWPNVKLFSFSAYINYERVWRRRNDDCRFFGGSFFFFTFVRLIENVNSYSIEMNDDQRDRIGKRARSFCSRSANRITFNPNYASYRIPHSTLLCIILLATIHLIYIQRWKHIVVTITSLGARRVYIYKYIYIIYIKYINIYIFCILLLPLLSFFFSFLSSLLPHFSLLSLLAALDCIILTVCGMLRACTNTK